jgi:hypothetical protein
LSNAARASRRGFAASRVAMPVSRDDDRVEIGRQVATVEPLEPLDTRERLNADGDDHARVRAVQFGRGALHVEGDEIEPRIAEAAHLRQRHFDDRHAPGKMPRQCTDEAPPRFVLRPLGGRVRGRGEAGQRQPHRDLLVAILAQTRVEGLEMVDAGGVGFQRPSVDFDACHRRHLGGGGGQRAGRVQRFVEGNASRWGHGGGRDVGGREGDQRQQQTDGEASARAVHVERLVLGAAYCASISVMVPKRAPARTSARRVSKPARRK